VVPQRPDIEVLITEDEIALRIAGLAQEIAAGDPGDVLVVVILKGSFVFAADLLRALERVGVSPQVDFLTLASYGESATSSGKVKLIQDLSENVAGRRLLLVDDILDSGQTLVFARDALRERGAAEIKTCVLLDKNEGRQVAMEADYVGFEIGNRFVIGYGLDFAHRFRGLPYIGVLNED
jgi:hypoxanthine phosphoribosyltransferase